MNASVYSSVTATRPAIAGFCLVAVACLLAANDFALHGAVGTWLAAGAIMLCIVWAIATYGVASALSVVVLVSLLYAFAPSYDLYLGLGMSFVDAGTYVRSFLPVFFLYCAAMIFGYALFYESTARSVGSASLRSNHEEALEVASGALFTLVVAALYLAMTVQRFGWVAGEFSRAEIYQHDNLDLRVVRAAVVCGTFVGFSKVLRHSRAGQRSWLPLLVLVLALGLLGYADIAVLGDRRVFVSVLIAVFVASRPKPVAILVVFLVGAPFAALLWVYSFLRNVAVDAWPRLLAEVDWRVALNLANGEFGGWTRIAADVFAEPFSTVWRLTLVEAPFALLPSYILPNRPLAPSLWYVNTFDPATAAIGGGWGFSLPIEAYINGWFVGPCVLGAIIGGVLGRAAAVGGFACMLAVFTLCFSFRSDVVSLLQQFALVAAFYILARSVALLGKNA